MPETQPIQWVGQEDANGCGIAAAAMIVRCTYREAREAICPGWDGAMPPGSYAIDQFLCHRGYEVIRLRDHYFPTRLIGIFGGLVEDWPPAPFAALHLCSVVPSLDHWNESHAVVMLADGSVLDPNSPVPRRLNDYPHVTLVAEVRKVAHEEPDHA